MSQSEKQTRASALIAELLRRRDSGSEIDEERVLASYPELAAELQEFFGNERLFRDALGHSQRKAERRETTGPGVGDSVPHGGARFDRLPAEFGRYRVQRVLGQGAMGAVYLARDTRLGRDVALKTPKLDASSDPELIVRFEREARAAAALHHRNICPVFDVGEIDGVRYLTMAYIDGKPLSSLVTEDKPLSESQAASIVRKLAVALHEAHSQGVVHRDLKPANVMMDAKSEPVVMDFGLAHQGEAPEESRLTAVGTLMGSPAYMSPEQVSGDPVAVGPESDIYSLGVVLFELLTGRLPFEGGVAAMIGQIMTAPTPGIREFRPECSVELDSVCRRMMAKDKSERFTSMQEVAAELARFLSSRRAGRVQQAAAISQQRPSEAPEFEAPEFAVLEQIAVAEETPVASRVPARSRASRRSVTRLPVVWLAAGALIVMVLAGVVIHFSDGTRAEIPDGTSARIETNADGTLQSISVRPTNEQSSGSGTAGPAKSSRKASASSVAPGSTQLSGSLLRGEPPVAINGIVKFLMPGGTASMAVSPDGRRLAITAFDISGHIQIRDLSTGHLMQTLEPTATSGKTVTQVSYSPDGKYLLCVCEQTCLVVSAETGQVTASSECPADPTLVVFPRRTMALVLFFEEQVHRTKRHEIPQRLRIWNWQQDRVVSERVLSFEGKKLDGPYHFPQVSPDEKLLTLGLEHYHLRCSLTIDGDEVSIGEPVAMEQTSRVRGPLKFSPDGKVAVTNLKSRQAMAAMLDVTTGKVVQWVDSEMAGSSNAGHQYGCEFAFSADGRQLITADHTGRARIWDVDTGEQVRELTQFRKTGNHVSPLVATSTSGQLVLAGRQGDPRVEILPLGRQ